MSSRSFPPCPPDHRCHEHHDRRCPSCEVEGGFTLLKIDIPAGAEITLLNLIQVISPSGICLIIRIPSLGGHNSSIQSLIQQVQAAGGTVEFLK